MADYAAPIKQRKWLIALLVIAAMITSAAMSLPQIAYEASSTIMLSPAALGYFNTPAALNAAIAGDELLAQVVKDGKLKQSISELKQMIHAENASGSSIVTITARGPDKTAVFKAANLTAEKFVALAKKVDPGAEKLAARLRTTRETIKWVDKILYKQTKDGAKVPLLDTSSLDNEINEAKSELDRVESEYAPSSERAILIFALNQRLAALEERRQLVVTQKLSLLSQEQDLYSQEAELVAELEKATSNKLLTRAVKPTVPAAPNIAGNLVFAGLAALIAGCGLAVWLGQSTKGDAP